MRYYFQAISIFAMQPLRDFSLGINNNICIKIIKNCENMCFNCAKYIFYLCAMGTLPSSKFFYIIPIF